MYTMDFFCQSNLIVKAYMMHTELNPFMKLDFFILNT